MSTNTQDRILNEVKGVLRFPLKGEGNDTPFVDIHIRQACYTHNEIMVRVKYGVLDANGWLSDPSGVLELLNDLMVVRLFHATTPDDIVYHAAVITDISFENEQGTEGDILLRGLSPSVMLDRGEHMEAYHNQSWEQLFDYVKEGIPNNFLDVKLNPVKGDKPSEFLLQYNEENYPFLSRVAAQHGEWLYHDGVSLCLGRPDDVKEPLTLTYDKDLYSMKISASRVPHKIERFAYDDLSDTELTSEGSDPTKADLATKAWERSEINAGGDIRPTKRHSSIPAYTQDIVDKSAQIDMDAKASASATISGIAFTCNVKLGQTIRIEVPESFTSAQKALGRYVVVSANHYISQRGEYRCEFTAVAEGPETIPAYNICLPQAQPLIGIVCDTNDPESKGRVQVELQGIANWGINDGVWFRVMSPDAGSSDAVEKNRGFVFIPEKGDQVVVNFMNGDTSRPFVMGSLFHGKNSQGGGANNTVKSIITKSGHTIMLNDDENGEWGITIKDTQGNVVQLNTKDKSINIAAIENINIHSKKICINADDEMEVNTGTLKFTAQGDVTSTINTKLTTSVKDSVELSTKKINSMAENITLDAGKEMKVMSGSKTKVAGGKVEIQGNSNKLELP